MEFLILLIGLLFGTVLVVGIGERIRLPYPVLMLIFSALFAFLPVIPEIHIDPELILPLFLPPLLYAAAQRSSWSVFRMRWRSLVLLAVAWGAIGARTTESQVHRQLASGLSMPIGFKNGTDGSLDVALDACQAALAPQTFLGIDGGGRASMVSTAGNPDTHVILRGGTAGPNFSAADVAAATTALTAGNLNPRLIIDASHANSGKSHVRQAEVALELAEMLGGGGTASSAVAGVMLESFIEAGRQDLTLGSSDELEYGKSITDACLDWATTAVQLDRLADAVRARRA